MAASLSHPRRRFTILDGMLLVASVAAGLAFARLGPPVRGRGLFEQSLTLLTGPASCLFVMPTLAIIPMRLLRPRPRLARVMCQPGMVASCAVAAAMAAAVTAWSCYGRAVGQTWLEAGFTRRFWILYQPWVSPAVAGAWLGLWFSGRWRRERSWIDRLGRIFGWFWIALDFCNVPLRTWTRLILDFATY